MSVSQTIESEATLPAERFQAGRVAIIATSHTAHDTAQGFLPTLLPLFIQNLYLSKTQAGLLEFFLRWPSVLQPVFGYIADRVSLRFVVILAPAVTTAAMSFLGIAPNYLTLALLLLAAGLSSAAFHAVAPPIAGRLSGSSLGRGMSIWMVGGELGRALGPLVVVTALRFLGLRGMPWLTIAGLLVSLSLYMLLRNVSDPRGKAAQGLPLRRALQRMKPVMLPVVGILVTRAFMSGSVPTFLPTYLTEQGAALWFAGISLTVLETAGIVGAFLSGSLSDRLGRRTVVFITVLTPPIFLFLFLSGAGWVRFPLLVLLGFTLLSITPVLMALVQESFPENRALANGLFVSTNFIIRSVAAVAVGALGDLLGLRRAFVVTAVIALLGLPLVALLPKRETTNRQPTSGTPA